MGCFGGCDNCIWIILIVLLLSSCCGGTNNGRSGCGCGC